MGDKHSYSEQVKINAARMHYDTRASSRPKQYWDHATHQWLKEEVPS